MGSEPHPPAQPLITALQVSDLERSLAFYAHTLGFALVDDDSDAGVATIDLGGYRLLLAGPGSGDLAAHLVRPHEIVPAEGTVSAVASDLDAVLRELNGRIDEVRVIERPWGERGLLVRDPDGYTVRFWAPVTWSPEETLHRYARGPDDLAAALRGLSAAELDRVSHPGAWSIRQIVHHLADAEAATLMPITFALAQPGAIFRGTPYSQDAWASALGYASRPIEPSVALFGVIRRHVIQMIAQVPDSFSRATRGDDGRERTVEEYLAMLAAHALEHIWEIGAIRSSV